MQVRDDSKLDSFIDKVLTPMVVALSGEPALAGYDIMNEPESTAKWVSDPNPCHDITLYQVS